MKKEDQGESQNSKQDDNLILINTDIFENYKDTHPLLQPYLITQINLLTDNSRTSSQLFSIIFKKLSEFLIEGDSKNSPDLFQVFEKCEKYFQSFEDQITSSMMTHKRNMDRLISDLKDNLGDLDENDLLFNQLDVLTKQYHDQNKKNRLQQPSGAKNSEQKEEDCKVNIGYLKQILGVLHLPLRDKIDFQDDEDNVDNKIQPFRDYQSEFNMQQTLEMIEENSQFGESIYEGFDNQNKFPDDDLSTNRLKSYVVGNFGHKKDDIDADKNQVKFCDFSDNITTVYTGNDNTDQNLTTIHSKEITQLTTLTRRLDSTNRLNLMQPKNNKVTSEGSEEDIKAAKNNKTERIPSIHNNPKPRVSTQSNHYIDKRNSSISFYKHEGLGSVEAFFGPVLLNNFVQNLSNDDKNSVIFLELEEENPKDLFKSGFD